MVTNQFDSVSIRGRYIYCYYCLKKVIQYYKLPPILNTLDMILKNFVENPRLDLWLEAVEPFQPSWVLEGNDESDAIIENNQEELRQYYLSQPELIREIIENLIWVGTSNIYTGFISGISLRYTRLIIFLLKENNIELPDYNIALSYPVEESGGWGNPTVMPDFVND